MNKPTKRYKSVTEMIMKECGWKMKIRWLWNRLCRKIKLRKDE